MSETPMPFEGNLIRAQDFAPCGCAGSMACCGSNAATVSR